jgi:outer membrane protein OmpA-like peptidoglycan-associated protein
MVHQGIEASGVSPVLAKRAWVPRASAVILVLGLTACSSLPDVPDYANPAEWYRSSTDMVGGWFSDEEPRIEAAASSPTKPATAKKTDEKFPNLGSVPEKPAPKSTEDVRQRLKNRLAADRDNARYTDEKPVAASKAAVASVAPKVTAKAAQKAAPKIASKVAPKVVASPTPQRAAAPAVAPKVAVAKKMASVPTTTYDSKRSSLWPNSPAPGSTTQALSTSARVGRPEVSSVAATGNSSAVRAPLVMPPKLTSETMSTASAEKPAMAAPEASSAPIAPAAPETPPRFTLTPPAPEQSASAPSTEMTSPVLKLTPPSGYSNTANANGQQPMLTFGSQAQDGVAGMITFGHGSARLSAADLSSLKRLAQDALSAGVYIRVVGHASMRTRNMDPFEHSLANFNVSLKRANVVASALIDMGVPAEQLIVDAVGDTQPLYSEAMPSGEEGNRRAEVYLES